MSLLQTLQAANRTPFHEKLNRQFHTELSQGFSKWCRAQELDGNDPAESCRFLRAEIERELDRLWLLEERHREFRQTYPLIKSESQRLQALLEYSRLLGADEQQLKGDRRAAQNRWFGPDALDDRWRKRKLTTQHRLVRLFESWGLSLAKIVNAQDGTHSWELSGGVVLFQRLESELLDPRVLQAALAALTAGISSLTTKQKVQLLDSDTVGIIGKWSRDSRRDVWVQAEAQRLLVQLAPDDFADLLTDRLQNPGTGDDFFVRARLLHRLSELEEQGQSCWNLLQTVQHDPSEFVRQEACTVLAAQDPDLGSPWLREFALSDESPRVRAAALAALRSTTERQEWRDEFVVDLLLDSLTNERDDFVLRVAAHVTGDWLTGVIETLVSDASTEDPPEVTALCDQIRKRIMPQLNQLRTTTDSAALRRQLALESERLWMLTSPHIRRTVGEIRSIWCKVAPGKARHFPRKYQDALGDDLGRALAVLAQDDFGYALERSVRGRRLRRGERTGFRIWRLLYEFRTPSPDKRQAHDHTVGRRSRAEIHAPSAIMSELSETKVPGEPVYSAHDASWRPFLPLLDDVLSTVTGFSRGRPVRFYTAEGVTILTPPRTIFKRWLAACRITLKFPQLAALRNWRHDSQHQPHEYAAALRRLGFELSFVSYEEETPAQVHDSSVQRYFVPALASLTALNNRLQQFLNDLLSFFYSPYQNTTWHLTLFLGGIALIFLGRHLYLNWKFRRQRRAIPLSIGGWGTRGKSGTERLKAALFCSLGYNVVSKSTGCEAMFLLSPRMGHLTEFFLFRPYDKATIWEQLDVVELASKWNADIFLWECMGLSPTYVEVLQRQWMQDDVATITNTYPDHEDLQGPTGADVARAIAGFVPRRSCTITTEREMRPLLEEAARSVGSDLKPVGWMEAGLLPRDILERFSYEEHPDNIALVLGLAAEFKIPRDVALKAMADELVADLGVLKTFPPSVIQTRTIEFTNGMSANERLGCLANWHRLGFDRHDMSQEPGTFVTTVVNNRADRVARSRVFAELIVNDLSADRHILIGNNLKGMQGYITHAWDRLVADTHLWTADGSAFEQPAEQILENLFRKHRRPTDEEVIKDRLEVMLSALLPESKHVSTRQSLLEEWRDLESLTHRLQQLGTEPKLAAAAMSFHAESVNALSEYEEISKRVRNARPGQRHEVTGQLHEMMKPWMRQKLVIVEDYHATGEQIIQQIVNATPPGFRNRVMGIQNIKGTGLEFVYRFQSWNDCHALCRQLTSGDRSQAVAALEGLSQFSDFGLLSEQYVLNAAAAAERRPEFNDHHLHNELTRLKARVEEELASLRHTLHGGHRQNSWKRDLLNWIEQFLDLGDAVRRRQRAEQVYRDIVTERIGLDQAAAILRDLNRRQKGGWLAAKFERKPAQNS